MLCRQWYRLLVVSSGFQNILTVDFVVFKSDKNAGLIERKNVFDAIDYY